MLGEPIDICVALNGAVRTLALGDAQVHSSGGLSRHVV